MPDASNQPTVNSINRAVDKLNFAPLDSRVANAVAEAVGVDPGRAVDIALEFKEPGVTLLAVRFQVDGAAMARVLDGLRAVPVTTPAPASLPEAGAHRSDPMSALLREIPFLLRIAHRLDEYLRPHEVDRAVVAESIEQHRKQRAIPPEQM